MKIPKPDNKIEKPLSVIEKLEMLRSPIKKSFWQNLPLPLVVGFLLIILFFIALTYKIFFQPATPPGAITLGDECSVIIEDCGEGCSYQFMCGEEERQCDIYNCKAKYQVFTKDKNGNQIIKDYIRPNLAQINENRVACAGDISLVEEKCMNQELRLKINISTAGQCFVKSFLVKMDGKTYSVKSEKENGGYNLLLSGCGRVEEIIAVTEGGLSIKKLIK